jgi:hypothetical protein
MINGYIKLYRKLIQSSVFQDEKLLKVWLWCLMKASYKDRKFMHGNNEVSVRAGQFICGTRSAADELNMSASTVYRKLKLLRKMNQIDTKVKRYFTVVTIINWHTYQDKGNEGETELKQNWNGAENKQEAKESKVAVGKPLPQEYDEFILKLSDIIKRERLPTDYTKSIGKRLMKPYQDYGMEKLKASFDNGIRKFKRNGHETGDVVTYCLSILHNDYVKI